MKRAAGCKFEDIAIIKGLLKRAVRVIEKTVSPARCRIYLYGSWAKGNATYTSDIDLAIDTGHRISDAVWFRLHDLADDLETLRTIEIIDIHDAGEHLKKNILRYGKVIN